MEKGELGHLDNKPEPDRQAFDQDLAYSYFLILSVSFWAKVLFILFGKMGLSYH